MNKNPAKNAAKEAQAADVKKAEKALAAKGITRPKHKPAEETTKVAEGMTKARSLAEQGMEAAEEGVDTPPVAAVKSGFSIFNPQPPKGHMMSTQDAAAVAAPAVTDEAKAKAAADKQAKADAKGTEKAAAAAKKATSKAERDAKATAAAAEKDAAARRRADQAATRAREREAAAAEAKANGLNYTGSMLALRDAKNTYVKGANGRLRSTDELALALDAVQPAGTIAIAKELLKPEIDPYGALNIGQQSMNWRNRLRGAIRKKTVTIEQVIAARDAGDFTADTLSARAAAEQKAKERAEAKVVAEAAAAQKKAAASAKATEPATV